MKFSNKLPTQFTGLFLAFMLMILLTACDALNTAQQPPRPVVVQVTPTLAVTASPTPAVAAEDTNSTENTATPLSTPTSTTVVQDNVAESPTEPTLSPAETESTPLPQPTAGPTNVPPTSTPAPPPAQQISLAALNVQLLPVANGFEMPVYLTHAGDGSGRLFVVEQPGRIKIVQDGVVSETPFLDIVPLVGSSGLEQGLLSVAFHPEYENNGFFFVNYTNTQGDTVIARYQRSDNPAVANPDSAKILLTIGQPYANHNGGHILFGPDGYLYVGMGDGGSANDPQNHGQNLGTLLGKILRLDVDNADPYGVPPTNPFIDNAEARPEIWSYGWRNPWRIAFDAATGDMYVADVGQNQYEEVHVEWAEAPGGQNYGWRLMEGNHCFNPPACDPAALGVELPVTEYDHSQGCSVTGGYVYRGALYPALNGVYLYGDYCTGQIWGLRSDEAGGWSEAALLGSDATITSFGIDEADELYLIDHKGTVFQVVNQSS